MKTCDSITDEDITNADGIDAYDSSGNYVRQLWGKHSLPVAVAPGAPPHRVNILNVELSDPNQLPTLIERITRIRGGVRSHNQTN